MATVTGLTADRMLEIEAASVVDGDIVGDNLILTKHDGSTINAGSVRGPQGDDGPVGSDTSILTAQTVLEVGQSGQIRAGRQLSAADFTDMGLAAPLGLWNLSNVNDSSGNGRNLSNKGAVPFDVGINGLATTAAKFVGSTSQALYISDTGAGDPFRVKTGSIGAWQRTGKRATNQTIISKWAVAAGFALFQVRVEGGGTNQNCVNAWVSPDGTALVGVSGVTEVADDRWHFIVVTFDGTAIRLYIDGQLDGVGVGNASIASVAAPLNIGGQSADASNAAVQPHFGRIDEAFVITDVLSEQEVRNLYCAKIAHALGVVPSRVSLNVTRRRRGAALVAGDFPTQPLRLHNFSGGSLGDDGSGAVALTNNGAAVAEAGADGFAGNAFNFAGAQSLSSTDTGLPSGTSPRSLGCWFKTNIVGLQGLIGWGTMATAMSQLRIGTTGSIVGENGTDTMLGPYVCDGKWHHAVLIEYAAVGGTTDDGVKRKLYLDGRLVNTSTLFNSITLAGANKLRIGAQPDASSLFTGQIDAVFVCNYVLTAEQIWTLFNKASQALALSPKNSGDHIEAMTSAALLTTFDSLIAPTRIDLKVAV